eukprot:8960139-Pyramimonas_sp.AAC.1
MSTCPRVVRAGLVVGLWLGTPCTTSSAANREGWRTALHPEGVPGLSPRVLARVQEGNHLATFSAGLFRLARSHGIP